MGIQNTSGSVDGVSPDRSQNQLSRNRRSGHDINVDPQTLSEEGIRFDTAHPPNREDAASADDDPPVVSYRTRSESLAMASMGNLLAIIDMGDCRQQDARQLALRFAHRRLGGQPLISKMVRRVSEATCVDQVVVTGSCMPQNLATAGIPGADVHSCTHSGLIDRLAGAAERFGVEWLLYLPGNRPFVDPVLIDQLSAFVARNDQCDYAGYGSETGGWQQVQQLGLAGEICHLDTLRRLRHNADRFHVEDGVSLAECIDMAPGRYDAKFTPLPDALDRDDLRFTIQSESDWDAAIMLDDSISGDVDPEPMMRFVTSNPTMLNSMQDRNRH
ncbi:MAG: NTP transferase domain-containing protein [Planctomycetota bacterium]